MRRKKRLYGIVGPSASGKGTVIDLVRQVRSDILLSVSYTTREPRKHEVHGRDYYFVTFADFIEKIAGDLFLEYAKNHGEYYGRLRSAVPEEGIGFLDIDIQGAESYRLLYGDCFKMIYLDGDEESLRQRLLERGSETQEQIERRLARVVPDRIRAQALFKKGFDLYIVNNDRHETARIILKMLMEDDALEFEQARAAATCGGA